MITPEIESNLFYEYETRSILSLGSLKMIYCTYFHSAVTYRLTFWGNSTQSVNIFKLQKRIIRIIRGAKPKDFCREFFKTLQILPLASQYILFIALFMVHNKDLFKINWELNKFNTKGNPNFFLPVTNLKMFEKGSCC